MEYAKVPCVTSTPCPNCDHNLLEVLSDSVESGDEPYWEYTIPVHCTCNRCDRLNVGLKWASAFSATSGVFTAASWVTGHDISAIAGAVITTASVAKTIHSTLNTQMVTIMVPTRVASFLQASMHAYASGKAEGGFKAHAAFVHYLKRTDGLTDLDRDSYLRWAPTAIAAYEAMDLGASRRLHASSISTTTSKTSIPRSPSTAYESITDEANDLDDNGGLPKTRLTGTEYDADLESHAEQHGSSADQLKQRVGAHERDMPEELDDDKPGAYLIGPNIIPVEVMDDTVENLRAAVSKRMLPLEYTAKNSKLERRITKTVDALINTVFTKKAIRKFREEHPLIEELRSKKWTGDRFEHRFLEQLTFDSSEIREEFAVKKNEVLPANKKAPRALIACGDAGQIEALLPISCIEHLLFDYFDEASIKHMSKPDAMERVARRFNKSQHGKKLHILEGDGSAWDTCCNKKVRDKIENRIVAHVINVLRGDPEIPDAWFDAVLADMTKAKIQGKHKKSGVTVLIDAIRQSGHRGTSCLNYLVNLVCWLSILADNPKDLIWKNENGVLAWSYRSAYDGKWYYLVYAFEGDDSLIGTTENIHNKERAEDIITQWTSLGFRMKLVDANSRGYATFTGYDFLMADKGLDLETHCPEIVRNIASSSFTASPLVINDPSKANEVGAAAMLARAENFHKHGPMCAYFSALGMAHIDKMEKDVALDGVQSLQLGLGTEGVDSVRSRLLELQDTSKTLDCKMEKLTSLVVPSMVDANVQINLLTSDFGSDPCDTDLARRLIPKPVWDPANFAKARR